MLIKSFDFKDGPIYTEYNYEANVSLCMDGSKGKAGIQLKCVLGKLCT